MRFLSPIIALLGIAPSLKYQFVISLALHVNVIVSFILALTTAGCIPEISVEIKYKL